ncbi:Glycosyltransferase involved in cell wall bisynthesis [Daejeonella rubra]|uniref:Glycosyltransferase involved in cell wall bisynthesis n=1 Tax=Daejeonella rubra TaxID=990371 RepID=A0A1G9QRI2_9SPHI|nr:glycosyltransferase family 2 protein [Daejeonella rubra]SDM13461.1 Glycosyltransferase involved in cell wall bisynthesis [Daejeonella rubra]
MLFSFVIPTYNRSEKVRRAIDSILVQPNWSECSEIVIVDDGSTDNTENSLQHYLKHDQIRLIKHDTNGGVAKAKNTGISNALNTYVVLLDSDDLLNDGGLAYLKNLVLNNDYDLFFCGTKALAGNKLLYDPQFNGTKTYSDLLRTSVGEYLPVCRTTLLKDNLLSNLRGYESVTWLNLAKNGSKLYFDREAIRLYDEDGDDRLSNRFNGIRNSIKMRDGYRFYLNEFGTDLKNHNYKEYLKIRIKLSCYNILGFVQLKLEHN